MAVTDTSWFAIQEETLASIGRFQYSPPLVSMSSDGASFSSLSVLCYFVILFLIPVVAKMAHVAVNGFGLKLKLDSFWRVLLVLLVVFILYCTFVVFLLWNVPFSVVPEKIREGQFGDSFGALNALFSGLAFSGVLITLLMQRKDLSETRNESIRQQTESQFYNMLNLQQQVVQAFDLHRLGSTSLTIQGRDCFRDWGRKLKTRYDELGPEYKYEETLERALSAYDKILQAHQGDLGVYFRSLYSIFRLISNANHVDRQGFANVVRSFLSDYELVLLFYNCLSVRGEKFKGYAKTYALFDNLDISLLPREEHVELMDKVAYGKNEIAINKLNDLKDRKLRKRNVE